jgi:hypothetical protein
MARIETDPNYSSPTFSRATAATDIFKKEDVQNLASAVSTHDHTSGKGLALAAGSIPDGTITSAKIADGTIVAGDLADNAVTTPKIADGSVTSSKLAAGAVTAPQTLITNGGFEIWQRGAGPFSSNGAFTADRWQINLTGGATLSVSRDSGTVDTGSAFDAQLVYSHVSPSVLEQKLEDFAGLRGRTITASARVRTSTGGGAVALRIQTTGTGAALTTGTAHSGGGTYETLTVTATIGAAVSGVVIGILLSASCTAFVDNVMLVVGSAAATHVPLHPADDHARCMRYYEVQGNGGLNEVLATGQAYSTTVAHFPIRFKVRKALTPTCTVGASGDNMRATAASGGAIGGSSQSCSDSTVDGTRLVWTGATASLIAGNATTLFTNTTSGTVIAEANP